MKIAKCLAGSEDLFLISYNPETEHIEDNKRHQIFNDDDNRVNYFNCGVDVGMYVRLYVSL